MADDQVEKWLLLRKIVKLFRLKNSQTNYNVDSAVSVSPVPSHHCATRHKFLKVLLVGSYLACNTTLPTYWFHSSDFVFNWIFHVVFSSYHRHFVSFYFYIFVFLSLLIHIFVFFYLFLLCSLYYLFIDFVIFSWYLCFICFVLTISKAR